MHRYRMLLERPNQTRKYRGFTDQTAFKLDSASCLRLDPCTDFMSYLAGLQNFKEADVQVNKEGKSALFGMNYTHMKLTRYSENGKKKLAMKHAIYGKR